MLRLLLDAGADVNRPDGNRGQTPLHVAAWHGAKAACIMLRNAGAALRARCEFPEPCTPRELAEVGRSAGRSVGRSVLRRRGRGGLVGGRGGGRSVFVRRRGRDARPVVRTVR